MNVNRASFEKVLEKTPTLYASGLAGEGDGGKVDFDRLRREIEGSYDEFALCCDWLLDSTPLKRVSFVAPAASALASHISEQTGRPVSAGALLAAVIHMRIPFQPLPDASDVLVGISLRSPTLADLKSQPRGERKRRGAKG